MEMIKMSGWSLCIALLLGMSSAARADILEPDVLIKNTVQDVLTIVKQDKEIKKGNQQKILALVNEKILPHFDFTHMTRLAVGRSWRTATPEQQQVLESEFQQLLVRTYTKAFTVYSNYDVEVKPLKMESGATDVTIRTLIRMPGGQPVTVDYDLKKTKSGWKAYDLLIEGVSMVTSYRSTFANEIQRGGIDGLIKTLVEKNKTSDKDSVHKAEGQ
ncbi:MAG: ABC transporter substrate-binding protein [Candidatus Nitrotoga sp.]